MSLMYPVIAVAAQAAHSPESGYNIYTYLFSILNLLVLFYLLKIILFKPVTKIMNTRTEGIKERIENAKNNTIIAQELKLKYENQILDAKEEREAILTEARKKALIDAENIIRNTKIQAEQIIEKANERAQREVELALEGVKNQITTLSLQAASKILSKNMDSSENRKLIDEFLDEAGVA